MRSRHFWGGRPLAALVLLAAGWATLAVAAEPAPAKSNRSGPIKASDWKNTSTGPITAAEIDALVAKEMQAGGVRAVAGRTTDEQFVRRVYLDLTGRLPLPADVTEFIADKDARKRAKLIDRLLDSDEYATHWARYWREVMGARLTDFRSRLLSRPFEQWMTKQLKDNRGWNQITRDLLTASGTARFDDDGKTGNGFFLASHFGADAANEQAAETARVFLGIQINCAQCHDHPFDSWKREQFHELAAYFARVRSRPMRDPDNRRLVGIQLVSARFGEHRMPSKTDPRRGEVVRPRFLDGKSPAGRAVGDLERRRFLADVVVGKNNQWFAAAFVNRTWGVLMGQSFYSPVDDLGPQREAVFGPVLVRLAGAFRGSDHDIKGLFRVLCNSQTYQRQSRASESPGEHTQFTASAPTRLDADSLWNSVTSVLGQMGGPQRPAGPRGFRRGGLEGLFKEEFKFDPSLKQDDVENSVSQALLLMNSPQLHQRLQARGTNLLGRILKAYPKDEDALRMVYLRALARKPSEREQAKCLAYVKKVGKRAEAFEDILWALINSTEFQTKR
jgi:uncharacterized protein DUF1549/uncharacterized protein DUF1553